MRTVKNSVEEPQTLDPVILQMEEHLKTLEEHKDYNSVFQRVYLLMTKEMQKRLASDFFTDPIWMERLLIDFADRYFQAMDNFHSEKETPRCWALAFHMAAQKQTFVLQDALLGINAHINYDLPLALHHIISEEKLWPDSRLMLHRRKDHERINIVLAELVDLVQNELSTHYARFIKWMDRLLRRHDEKLSSFFLSHCRTNVWYNTELLLNTTSLEQFKKEQQRMDQEAHRIGIEIATFHSRRFFFTKPFVPLSRKYKWF
ncbi:hypothetical protein GLV98_13770 [Halobacillus litoralis]|uniref:Uncharacterized protein n=1 Tax=Halobacillus litoralis TaxID=45668 RepID=A0A845EFX1_9BACI|nr:DUF5995 family protein [Halobacillus litoralis]MYL50561.1 hypothetical protein [Halobacillus litoralis]